MISFASFIVTKFILKIHIVTFENKKLEQKTIRIMLFLLALAILPSIYFAYTVVKKNTFERKVELFIDSEVKQKRMMILSQSSSYHAQDIEIFLMNKISK